MTQRAPTVSEVLVKDTRMCTKSARIALETGVATMDRDGSPARALNQGYIANRVLAELRQSLDHARKAESLLAVLEEGGEKPDGTT